MRYALIVLLLSGCATGLYVPHADYQGPDAATVYLIREDGFAGSAGNMPIYIDTQPVSELGPGQYEIIHLKPGPHSISTKAHAITPTLKAGQTVYYRLWYPVLTGTGANLLPISEVSAHTMLERSKPL